MLLSPANSLPPKEVIFEHVAVATGAFEIELSLTLVQIELGVKLFVNGILQKPDSFTVTIDGVQVPLDLEVITGDILHIQYYEAL